MAINAINSVKEQRCKYNINGKLEIHLTFIAKYITPAWKATKVLKLGYYLGCLKSILIRDK